MPRITRRDLENALRLLSNATGRQLWTSNTTVGLCLEKHPGGKWIVKQVNPDTSESDVFGSALRSAGELYDCLNFARIALPDSGGYKLTDVIALGLQAAEANPDEMPIPR